MSTPKAGPPDAAAPLRLGVLDQSPIAAGSTGAQALRNTLELARLADELGFQRYWVAEHHGSPMLAGASPEALIGAIAGATSRLRVGSGGVMLPHYSPLKVAETFSALSGLFGGRIDLGLGRTDGTDDPVTQFALQRDRNHPAPDDFPQQLAELLALVDGTLPGGHLFERLAPLLPGRPEAPQPWLLGSSPQSAVWAAQLGLPYAFADFINRDGAEIVRLYRDRFVASARLTEPRVLVAVWALCAASDDEADLLTASARMVAMLARKGKFTPVPEADTAARFVDRRTRGGRPEPALAKRMVAGAPATVRAQLDALAAAYGVSELLVVNITHEHEARLRSYALLAEAYGIDRP